MQAQLPAKAVFLLYFLIRAIAIGIEAVGTISKGRLVWSCSGGRGITSTFVFPSFGAGNIRFFRTV